MAGGLTRRQTERILCPRTPVGAGMNQNSYMAKGLTTKQRDILQYILDYKVRIGYPPSIREIGKDFQIGSLRGVTVHLDALERKGYINRSNLPRSINVIHPEFQQQSPVAMLPLVGDIAAGVPILADENVEDMIPVPVDMIRNPEGAFVLRVRGDSMIGDGIFTNDLLVVRPQQEGRQNELVAVLMDGKATVKRMKIDGKAHRLMPSNPDYEPIDIESEEDRVIGKVVGLIRQYA
jgi:repressor LexA